MDFIEEANVEFIETINGFLKKTYHFVNLFIGTFASRFASSPR